MPVLRAYKTTPVQPYRLLRDILLAVVVLFLLRAFGVAQAPLSLGFGHVPFTPNDASLTASVSTPAATTSTTSARGWCAAPARAFRSPSKS